jgi:hypothetical protein
VFILSDRFLNGDHVANLREHVPESLHMTLWKAYETTRRLGDGSNYRILFIGEHANCKASTEPTLVSQSSTAHLL